MEFSGVLQFQKTRHDVAPNTAHTIGAQTMRYEQGDEQDNWLVHHFWPNDLAEARPI